MIKNITPKINENIEVMEGKAGDIIIQNKETKNAAHLNDRHEARESLFAILRGEDMSGWKLSNPERYITDKHSHPKEYTLLGASDLVDLLAY